jgi:hypothetical protein
MAWARDVPKLLWAAALLLLLDSCGLILMDHPRPADLGSLALAAGFALLLLFGSRIVWVLLVLGLVLQLLAPMFTEEPAWRALTSLVVLAGLVSPGAREFMYENQRKVPLELSAASLALVGRIQALTFQLRARIAEREALPNVSGRMIGLLILVFFLSVPLIGVFADFREGNGDGPLIVQVIWRILWVAFNILQILIVSLLIVAAYNHFISKPTEKTLDA